MFFTKRLMKWIGIPLTCWLLVFCLSNRTELAETYERLKCGGDACPVLTTEELRWRFIKSYLHYMLNERTPASDGPGYDELVLLPTKLSAQRLVKEIEEGTVLTTLTTNALPLNTHDDIDALTPNILTKYPSIAGISLSYRQASVTLMQSIQPIRLEGVDADYTNRNPYEEVARRIGRWERFRGYGKYFFEMIEYGYIDLSCCVNRPMWSNEKSPVERQQDSIEIIQSDTFNTDVLVASDRGRLLFWDEDSGAQFVPNHVLFSIESKAFKE